MDNIRGYAAKPSDPVERAVDFTVPETFDVVLSTDTSAYVAGDVLADTQLLGTIMSASGQSRILYSVKLTDADDQGAALDLYFLSSSVSMGTENSAPSISDANAREILGFVSVAASDWKDLGGVRVANPTIPPIILTAAATSRDIYLAAITQGTPTHTASGLSVKVGVI